MTVSNSKFAILVGIALVIPLMQPMNGYVNYWSNLLRTLEEQNDVIEASTCADPGQLPLYVAAEAVRWFVCLLSSMLRRVSVTVVRLDHSQHGKNCVHFPG